MKLECVVLIRVCIYSLLLPISLTEQLSGMVRKVGHWLIDSVFTRVTRETLGDMCPLEQMTPLAGLLYISWDRKPADLSVITQVVVSSLRFISFAIDPYILR